MQSKIPSVEIDQCNCFKTLTIDYVDTINKEVGKWEAQDGFEAEINILKRSGHLEIIEHIRDWYEGYICQTVKQGGSVPFFISLAKAFLNDTLRPNHLKHLPNPEDPESKPIFYSPLDRFRRRMNGW